MGRTNPTFRDQLRRFEEQWQNFRRGLRQPHQERFDELIEMADQFAAAAGYQNPPYAYQAIFLSIVLAQEIQRQRLEERVAALEDANEAEAMRVTGDWPFDA